jgi:hypothetical protein
MPPCPKALFPTTPASLADWNCRKPPGFCLTLPLVEAVR